MRITILLVLSLTYLSLHAQDGFGLDVNVGYVETFHTSDDYPTQGSHLPYLIEARLMYDKYLSNRSELSIGLGVGALRYRYPGFELREDILILGVRQDLTIFRSYRYLSVPVLYRHRISSGKARSFFVHAGIAPTWAMSGSNSFECASAYRPHIIGVFTEAPNNHPTPLNFIYQLGLDYRLATTGRWQHSIGIEGRLSDLGVYDETPGILENGEWALNLAYRGNLVRRK